MNQTRWQQVAEAQTGVQTGADYATAYAERFAAMAAAGNDIHGEATFVAGLRPAPARVLDAGCGTGRITVRLSELGYTVVGVDVDASMLGVAAAQAPDLDWRKANLADFDLAERFDLVLLAGNILPLLEPGTLEAVCRRLAAHLADDGQVVCGFGLDGAHLPAGCPPTPLAEVEAAMERAGLSREAAYATWDGAPYDGGGYVVTVHRGPRG